MRILQNLFVNEKKESNSILIQLTCDFHTHIISDLYFNSMEYKSAINAINFEMKKFVIKY